MQRRKVNWPNTNQNRRRQQITQAQCQNKQEEIIFNKFRDQIIENLASFYFYQIQSSQEKIYTMEDQKQQVINPDDLLELCSQEEDFMRDFDIYVYPKCGNKMNRSQSEEQKLYDQIKYFEGTFEENYEGHAQSNAELSSGQECWVRVEEASQIRNNNEMIEEQSENQSILKQQQSTTQTKKFYVKIPDDHDFVIFTVKCPKIGISNQELLMKKESLQSRGFWAQQRNNHQQLDQRDNVDKNTLKKNKNKRPKKPKQKQTNISFRIPTNQNSTKMRTRRDDNNQHFQHIGLDLRYKL